MSLWESTGLDIQMWRPRFGATYTAEGSPLEEHLGSQITTYMHTISAFGGFDMASFTVPVEGRTVTVLGEWLERIGSHVAVYGPGHAPAWEGFANMLTIALGPRVITLGPLTGIGNRVEVVYSTVDASTDPPTMGVRTRTVVADDTASQGLHGIIHKVISVGGTTDIDADQIRDTWLVDNAYPARAQQYAGGMGGESTVTVDCLGYVHWLKLYPYNQTTTTGTMDLDAKLQAVLGADPNGLFSTDYSQIVRNTLQVKQWEDTDSTAHAVIQALTAMGDTSSNRHLFGIYENRRAYYKQMPAGATGIEYLQQASGRDQTVWAASGLAAVQPWLVRPGRWLMYADPSVGPATIRTLVPSRDDVRFEFIESVTYTAPWSVQHHGGKVTTLPQMLARLGLGGMAS